MVAWRTSTVPRRLPSRDVAPCCCFCFGCLVARTTTPRTQSNDKHGTHSTHRYRRRRSFRSNTKRNRIESSRHETQKRIRAAHRQRNPLIDRCLGRRLPPCCPPRWVLEWNGCIGLAFVSHRVVYKPTTTNLLGLVVFPGQDRRSMSRNARDAIACNIDRKLAWLPPVRSPSPPSELPIRVLLPPNVRRRCRHCAIACRGIVCS